MDGELKKMKICSYPTVDMKDGEEEVFHVQLNPEKYERVHQILYTDNQSQGSTGQEVKFDKKPPEKMTFEFLFDRTGAVPTLNLEDDDEGLGVDAELNEFKKKTIDYKGDAHRPRFLKLSWGNLLFKCCLESMHISYQLFRPNGSPLRATAKCTFRATEKMELIVKKKNDQSNDITHLRQVLDGDTLPALTNKIYGNPKYYLEVAKANRLKHFRELTPSMKLIFPPVQK